MLLKRNTYRDYTNTLKLKHLGGINMINFSVLNLCTLTKQLIKSVDNLCMLLKRNTYIEYTDTQKLENFLGINLIYFSIVKHKHSNKIT
jgi:hypothetical protein